MSRTAVAVSPQSFLKAAFESTYAKGQAMSLDEVVGTYSG
jgi:hypothetical protein